MKTKSVLVLMMLTILGWMSPNTFAQAEKQKVKIASGGHLVHFLPLDLAVAKGMFTAQGLDVEVVQLQSGTPVAVALLSGQVDFSMNGIDHAFKAAVQGKPDLRMILLLNRLPGMTLVVDATLKDSVKSIADLKGKALAVTSKGAATHMVLAALLQKAGVNINDVTLVEVKPPTFAAALENKQIAGGIALEPVASMLAEQGKVVVLADLNKLADTEKFMGGTYNLTCLATRQDVLDTKPALAQKTAAVLREALKWIQEHSPEEIADALPTEVVGTDKARYVKTLGMLREFYSPDGVINAAGVQNVYHSMVFSGGLPSDTKLDLTTFYLTPEQLAGLKPAANIGGPNRMGTGWRWIAAGAALVVIAIVFLRARKSRPAA